MIEATRDYDFGFSPDVYLSDAEVQVKDFVETGSFWGWDGLGNKIRIEPPKRTGKKRKITLEPIPKDPFRQFYKPSTSSDADWSWDQRTHMDEMTFRHQSLERLMDDLKEHYQNYARYERAILSQLSRYNQQQHLVTPSVLNSLAKDMLKMKIHYEELQSATKAVMNEAQVVALTARRAFRLPESQFRKMIDIFQRLLKPFGLDFGPPTTTPIYIQQFVKEVGLPTTPAAFLE